ncbi:MAG: hypothetical protein G8D28_02715, partial [gamma proteobacterium symbiont of Phacoides pectinatus]
MAAVLERHGWRRAGLLRVGPAGIERRPGPGPGAGAANKVYSVDLPSTAPLMVQADLLAALLRDLKARHPDEPCIWRDTRRAVWWRVCCWCAIRRSGPPRSSPSPPPTSVPCAPWRPWTRPTAPALSAWFKDLFGGTLYQTVKHSRGVLIDLTPPHPGTLLHWLNLQPHPDIAYHSIVRPGPTGMGDELVPAFSQDMNSVPALRGRSRVVVSAAAHGLAPGDAPL